MKKILTLVFALAATGLSPAVLANETGYGFLRVEAGNSKFGGDADGDDNAFGVRGGYYFSRNIALEGFYTQYGKDSDYGYETKVDGYGVGVALKKNFNEDDIGFYLGGRAGLVNAKVKIAGDDDTDLRPYVGVALGYDFTRNFGLGLNYDYTKLKPELFGTDVDVKVTTLTLSGEFRF
ncbi:porin family protein [Luteimonas aquatica]|uniref:porin family protein n=1 Tax=Luteimonas aquatica TaxID=450364 RepID=UPI001F5A75C9|nr:porin family protein [Luteimonas aquatica]